MDEEAGVARIKEVGHRAGAAAGDAPERPAVPRTRSGRSCPRPSVRGRCDGTQQRDSGGVSPAGTGRFQPRRQRYQNNVRALCLLLIQGCSHVNVAP